MPSPVRPSQICATVPTTASDFCAKIKLVLLQLPNYLCQLFEYQYNEDGSLTEEFKSAASPLSPGDLKWSASAVVDMGWLYCNGQAVSRTTYAALFARIGTTYGIGDGSTTFNVPDMRGYFALGVSSAHAIGTSGGSEEVTLTLAQMPAHQHQFTGRPYIDGTNQASNEVIIDDDWSGGQLNKTTDTRGSDQPHSNMPPYKTFFVYIKY